MKKLFKHYSIIILLSLISFLYLGEYYLTFVVYEGGSQNIKNLKKKVDIYKKKTGRDYDTRTKDEVYEQEFKKNKSIVVSVEPFHKTKDNFFYLSGISNSKTIDCNENGYYSSYVSDRYGFNNVDKEWDSKNFEFVVVGDSLVAGSCVNRPHDITSNLKSISNKPSLGLGLVGNGPLSEYATLVEYMPKNVKNILWVYSEHTDLTDLISELNNEQLKKYLSKEKFFFKLKSKQHEIDSYHKERIQKALKDIRNNKEFWNSYYSKKKIVLRFLRLNNFKVFIKSLVTKKENVNKEKYLALKKMREILSLTKQLAFINESNLYFIYISSFYRYKNFIINDPYKKDYEKIIELVEELNIPIIDIHKEFFLKQNNPLQFFPFESYGHFTKEGYEKISNLIYSQIIK